MNLHINQSFLIRNIFYFSIINIILQLGILYLYNVQYTNKSSIGYNDTTRQSIGYNGSLYMLISNNSTKQLHSLLYLPYPYYLKSRISKPCQDIRHWKKTKKINNLKYIKGQLIITLFFLLYFI